MRRTNRRMIRRALELAIEREKDLLDAMSGCDPKYEAKIAGDIQAFRRILGKFFGVTETPAEAEDRRGVIVSIRDVVEGKLSADIT